MERIQKILSAHGAASRREAERMIADGRVAVNGVIAVTGQSADPDKDVITVDGSVLTAPSEKVYIMLNKPRGYVTTMKDERGRKTVRELTADVGVRVYPAGRLDIDSEGLLIMTSDGEFANTVMHPSFEKTKRYRVSVSGGDVQSGVEALKQPVSIDSYMVTAVAVRLLKLSDDGGVLDITVREGRNRQIRKMCALCGLEVKRLRRVAVGALELGSLPVGKWRHLTDDEIRLILR